jgi:D-amino-acid oxidase
MHIDITVVGAGVSGLTTAVELQRAGAQATVKAMATRHADASSVAAAIWHPFFQGPDDSYLRRAAHTYDRLLEFADSPSSGVIRRRLTEFFREATTPPWWMTAMADRGTIAAASAPDRYASAFTFEIPVADSSRYLSFLKTTFLDEGGVLKQAKVDSLAEESAAADWVVNCTGLGSAELTGDSSLTPVRGLVLRCAKVPGLPEACWIDDSDSSLPTYVLDRGSDLILGGTADAGSSATAATQAEVQGILERCAALVPQIADVHVLETKVGFRPARDRVRLEQDPALANVIHDYGHGGSGYTLSWGCAAEVAQLLAELKGNHATRSR